MWVWAFTKPGMMMPPWASTYSAPGYCSLRSASPPHGDDLLAIDGDGARLEVGIVLVAGDDATVSDKQHMRAPFFVGGGV